MSAAAVTIVDQAAREQALDIGQSFIVQAPAGSGKTGLLTQRLLRLLAVVERPESIIAITFTRKAAAEMRQRVLAALHEAAMHEDQPLADLANDWQRQTRQLALAALHHDRQQGWGLLDNPSRLQLKTFDSLCAWLSGQMPVLSELGAAAAVTEDAEALYRQAALSTLERLSDDGDEVADAIETLLRHTDNRLAALQSLIANMLQRRDQWLRHVADPEHPKLERDNIERALAGLISEYLQGLIALIPADGSAELAALCRYAGEHIEDADKAAILRGMDELPASAADDLSVWQMISGLMLTHDGNWRKGISRAQGFPAPSSAKDKADKARFTEMKQRLQQLIDAMRDDEALHERLAGLRSLPSARYSDDEWAVLDALFALLRHAVAHLRLEFQGRGQVDYAEVAMAAVRALGPEDAPTDLNLRLDYQVQHLLVDEFQDTSVNQFLLLQRLTAGWQPGDGRSLFLVGDPMQSIYRFREAEVGLFLEAKTHGIGDIALTFLQLQSNFRSRAGIVEWINDSFPQVLPASDDPVRGAVSYSAAQAVRPGDASPAVTVHRAYGRDDAAEAEQILQLVRQAMDRPGQRTAILVRGRSHLVDIVHRLRDAAIPFQAVEIDALSMRPEVQDLLALSRALLHLADRISWLALLRAPYCGLALADLHALCADAPQATIWSLLNDPDRIASLSADAQQRLQRILPVLSQALARRARRDLRGWVEGTWIALGGPACLRQPIQLADAESFLQLLASLDHGGDVDDLQQLSDKTAALYAPVDVLADERLQIMTIHKAKGLEFETVIVPGLARTTGHAEARLLYWLERQHSGGATGETELLFGPIRAASGQQNHTAEYIKRLETDKTRLEAGRLLYVAATRARENLHLFASVEINRDGEIASPRTDSLLACLWPVVQRGFEQGREQTPTAQHTDVVADDTGIVMPAYQRIAADWQCPLPPAAVTVAQTEPASSTLQAVEFDWAGELARHVGTVVHRLLEHLGRTGTEQWSPALQSQLQRSARSLLQRQGVAEDELQAAQTTVVEALHKTLMDERGRWILSPDHEQARSELALTAFIEGQYRHMVIDRSFVDEQGTRWIIDFKTGGHSGGGLEAFFDSEVERYRGQLNAYARAMQAMAQGPVRLALYFPLYQGWRAWDA